MPRRSRVVEVLTPDDRAALDERLSRSGFRDYAQLTAWLRTMGYAISLSSLKRYGHARQAEVEMDRRLRAIRIATEQAERVRDDMADDEGVLAETIARLLQTHLLESLLDDTERNTEEMHRRARALADTVRAGTTLRADRRKIRAEVAAEAEQHAVRAGIGADTAAALRAALTT